MGEARCQGGGGSGGDGGGRGGRGVAEGEGEGGGAFVRDNGTWRSRNVGERERSPSASVRNRGSVTSSLTQPRIAGLDFAQFLPVAITES